MSRSGQILVGLLGGALLKISYTGDYLRYVRPGQHHWLLATGATMVALALIPLLRDAVLGTAPTSGPAHQHHERRCRWLLLVPTIYLVAPPALGADAVAQRPTANPVGETPRVVPPLPTGGVPALPLSELVIRMLWDPAPLIGRELLLTGFVVHRGEATELARMVITCCAADARPITVRLVGPAAVPASGWLRVRVTVLPGSATPANGYRPSVRVLEATAIPAPVPQYEY
jgi:uncharacterized repeat protein (TIGR03943 family)